MNNTKAITHIPGWVENLENKAKVTSTARSYSLVPLVYRAMRIRCNALASVPLYVQNARGDDVGWPFPTGLSSLFWQTEAALLLTGGGYWLKKSNRLRVLDVQWLNPFTVSVDIPAGGGEVSFRQQAQGTEWGPWAAEEMVYFREFDPSDDIGPGIGAAEVALTPARLVHNINEFASAFFAGGAMPAVVLGIEGNPSPQEVERIEGLFKRFVTGVKNAFRVIALRGQVKPAILTPPMADLALPELSATSRQQIALAFGIPETLLEDAANYATAREHRKSFWTETIRPRLSLYSDVINQQLLGPMGLTIKFAPEELDIFQEDEERRANAFQLYVQSGLQLGVAAEMLGLELPEGVEYADLDNPAGGRQGAGAEGGRRRGERHGGFAEMGAQGDQAGEGRPLGSVPVPLRRHSGGVAWGNRGRA